MRSKFEGQFRDLLVGSKVKFEYEPDHIPYVIPESTREYTPDWKISDNLYIETKGKLDQDTRKKMILFKQQHPDIQIIFVFQRSKNKISKRSKTTYADWCVKNGFTFFDIKDFDQLLKLVREK